MAKVEDQIALDIKKKLFSRLPRREMQALAEEIGTELLFNMQDRIADGKDIRGKTYKRYKPNYRRFKKRVIKNKDRKRHKRWKRVAVNRSIRRLIRAKRPAFAAKQINDWIQLTGQLMAAMRFKVLKANKSKIRIKFFVDDSRRKENSRLTNEELASYVQKDREFFGIAKRGKWNKQWQQTIVELVNRRLGNRVKEVRIG